MSDASLRSARIYSLVILVLGYVGLSFVWGHQQRLATLTEAREAMARIIVASSAGKKFPAIGTIEQEGETIRKIRVRRPGGGEWGVADLSVPANDDIASRTLDRSLARLYDVAARIGIFESQGKNASELYVQIEQRTLDSEVMVPGVGLGFHGMQVVWVCVIATFGFLVILRDRVQHVLSDKGLAMSERWLIIDGRGGIERILSRLWLVALVVIPITLSSGLIVGVTKQIDANGATSTLAMDGLMAAGVITLLVGNGWLALTAASRILELRLRRLAVTNSSQEDGCQP